jgi:hypothetical protein
VRRLVVGGDDDLGFRVAAGRVAFRLMEHRKIRAG